MPAPLPKGRQCAYQETGMFIDASEADLREPAAEITGAPYGTRTRVTAVKGRCPGPLDEGRGARGGAAKRRRYRGVSYKRQARTVQRRRNFRRHSWACPADPA